MARTLVGRQSILAFTATLVGIGPAAIAGYTHTLAAQQSMPAPGYSGGEEFGSLGSTSALLNNSGEVCFIANLSGFPSARAIFAGLPGQLSKVVGTGDPAPGAGDDVRFLTATGQSPIFAALRFDHGSNVAFAAQLEGAGVVTGNNSGVWGFAADGAGWLAAREGALAPGGANNATFRDFSLLSSGPAISMNQRVLGLYSLLQGTSLPWDQGLWTSDGGPTALAVREGENAAGGGVYTGGFRPFVTANDESSACVTYQGSSNFFKGAWIRVLTWSSGTSEWLPAARIARESAGIPGVVGISFVTIDIIEAAAAGHALVAGLVSGVGVTPQDEHRMYVGTAGGLVEVARRAWPTSGPFTGVTIVDWRSVRTSSSGTSVFLATLAGPGVSSSNDQAVVLVSPGSQAMIRKGDPAPTMAVGVSFLAFESVAINASGEIVFSASVQGPGINSTNNDGFWSWRSGVLERIVHEGDVLPFAPTGSVAMGISIAPPDAASENGWGSHFNDVGQLAFAATGASGATAIFVASPDVDLPCPADHNGDGVVNFGDLNIVLSGYNDAFDFEDLNAVLSAFGDPCP